MSAKKSPPPKSPADPAYPEVIGLPQGGFMHGRSGMTIRQHAAIALCVPDSGVDWLDRMIEDARREKLAGVIWQGMLADPSYTVTAEALGEEVFRLAAAVRRTVP